MSTLAAYPSVTLPVGVTSLGDITMSSGTQNIAGGTYLIHNLNLRGTAVINWTGPVVLYVQGTYSVSGGVIINTTF